MSFVRFLIKEIEKIMWKRIEEEQFFSDKKGVWHLVHVLEGDEGRIGKTCSDHGIPFFLSVLPEDTKGKINVAWPGYLFCKLSDKTRLLISEEKNVQDIQIVSDQKSLIEQLKKYKGTQPSIQNRFKPGDQVRIYLGPFSGYKGIIKEFRSNGKKARIELINQGKCYDVEMKSESIIDPNTPTPEEISLATVSVQNNIRKQISVSVDQINKELISYLARHPSVLYEISPYKFEELVAELLIDMGYSVHLTPPTRDGGRDILAVFKIPLGEILTIVDCKRYSLSQKIGPDIIQRLLWLADNKDKASRAMIATTTFFTSGAKDLAQEYKWRLTLSDFNDVNSWLKHYGNWKQDEKWGLWLPKTKNS